jgi:hypothetical protein
MVENCEINDAVIRPILVSEPYPNRGGSGRMRGSRPYHVIITASSIGKVAGTSWLKLIKAQGLIVSSIKLVLGI